MISRRHFIRSLAAASLSTAAGASVACHLHGKPNQVLGVALVGLGYYSTDLLAPALQLTQYCKLKGIVTGSPWKIPLWQEKYDIPDANVYDYESMHRIADNPEIDVIYIVLPTGLHAQYSVVAAEAGKHVWCEKPMARTAEECQSIIDACRQNKVKLSIGYRMQHEPNTQTIMRWAGERPFGAIQKLKAEAGYFDGRTDHWKQDREMGGGAMYDMGVYPLNAARYATGEEPIAVTARHTSSRPKIYHEVDETTYFQLEFPSGAVADCATSLGKSMNELRVDCADGWYYLKPFQAYRGIKGKASDGTLLNASIPNQQARQMDDDAFAILKDKPVLVPGEEGLRDIRIVEAVYRAARSGERVTL